MPADTRRHQYQHFSENNNIVIRQFVFWLWGLQKKEEAGKNYPSILVQLERLLFMDVLMRIQPNALKKNTLPTWAIKVFRERRRPWLAASCSGERSAQEPMEQNHQYSLNYQKMAHQQVKGWCNATSGTRPVMDLIMSKCTLIYPNGWNF